ncbi:hypothetical protein HG536_0B01890 [Torulaspora globosa]|uniref:CCZ1/INTU/HSP4 first Longin domain-containing protein n=1 Tax=Torulaspora globosa TaxID=48254 RepID=A0A7G3ZCU0_9SACH|nr:uncharacterized protein HG536_0B01890 [Torulaspora globosa]QLL31326.1 hypothetical protein HG536_0B01890 [Torulaspora globosa]
MLQYVTVFDPSQSDGEDEVHKQLLLYHSFEDLEITLNEKLGRIGMIQGIWSLTDSFGGMGERQEKVVELHKEVILIIKVECRFFISLCVSTEEGRMSPAIPHELYVSQLWYCYQIFVLHYGPFSRFEDMGELTDLLNEQIVPFWHHIQLKPETIVRRGIAGLWPDGCKVSQLEFDSSGESWESLINQNILLAPENYMAVKDVLVYHLPSYNDQNAQFAGRRLGYKTYGLVRHFSDDISIVTQLSNWIYHLHAVHGDLSSHVLAGNAHYEEAPSGSDGVENAADNSTELSSAAPSNLQAQGRALLHNLMLPLSFAYDAVHEVGSTTGISKSMSLIMDYVPRWDHNASRERENDRQRSRCGYLISPLCSGMLPMSYRVKKVVYESSDGHLRSFNLLFWFYDDVLVVTVCEPEFAKIWDSQYLEDLSYKFRESITRFYETAFQHAESKAKGPSKRESFAYTTYSKITKEIKCSVPAWFDSKSDNRGSNPMKLVVDGVDHLFGLNSQDASELQDANRNPWGLDIMGSLLGFRNDKTNQNVAEEQYPHFDRRYENFLDGMTQEKLWGLQVQTIQFLTSIKNSNRACGLVEERLSKLNNGLLCYIKQDDESVSVVIRNWFEHREDFESHKRLSDFGKVLG